MTFAGLPTAKEFSGIFFVTTAPAPITHPSPIVTPGRTITEPPSQQFLPIVIGFADYIKVFLVLKSRGCIGV